MNEAIEKVLDKLDSWIDGLAAMLPNLAVALIAMALFWLVARLARRAVAGAADRAGKRRSVVRLLGGAAWAAVLAVGLIIALGVLQLDKTVTSLLAGAGIAGVALGFAVQSFAASLMAGLMISLRGRIRIGDLVETNGHFGTVERIDLRSTTLRTPQGQLVVVPNKEILEQSFVNYSTRGERRVDVPVGVSYSDNLETARRIAVAAASEVAGRDRDRDVELFYRRFGDSSIDFVVRFWIDSGAQADFLAARSEAIERIKQAFDEHGITIPFPIRTLELGGNAESIGDVLPGALERLADQAPRAAAS